MELSKESGQISPSSKPFGKMEMDYLQWISLSLQNPPSPGTVKAYLKDAQADGLDPEEIYEAAVRTRPSHWMPAPAYVDVVP